MCSRKKRVVKHQLNENNTKSIHDEDSSIFKLSNFNGEN